MLNIEPNHFIDFLRIRLLQPLPGNLAHKLMYFDSEKIEINKDHINSAVILLLFPKKIFYSTLLIKRSVYKGPFNGDMALPGGKFNELDETLEQTALRELHEELGIKSDNLLMLGKLTDLYIKRNNILITPYIAYIPEKPKIKIDLFEVADCFEVDTLEFLPNKIRNTFKLFDDGNSEFINYFDILNNTVWGITGMIISEFGVILNEYLQKENY